MAKSSKRLTQGSAKKMKPLAVEESDEVQIIEPKLTTQTSVWEGILETTSSSDARFEIRVSCAEPNHFIAQKGQTILTLVPMRIHGTGRLFQFQYFMTTDDSPKVLTFKIVEDRQSFTSIFNRFVEALTKPSLESSESNPSMPKSAEKLIPNHEGGAVAADLNLNERSLLGPSLCKQLNLKCWTAED